MKNIRKKSVFFIASIALVLMAFPISLVSATKPMPVQGMFFPSGPPGLERRTAGDNLFLSIIDGPQTWTGSFAGSAISNGYWIIHKYSDTEAPGYHINAVQCFFELDVEYAGLSGTLTIRSDRANWRIIGGTGGLANLRGQGKLTVINIDNMIFGYEGKVHFEP